MLVAARLVQQLWLIVNRGNCGACRRRMAELTFLPMLILSHTDAFVTNVGPNENFSLDCSKNYLCTNDSGIYILVTSTQVLLGGKTTCDMAVRNSISLEIQNHLNDVCTSARKTTNSTLNISNLPYLSNCTGITTLANLSFETYYNCTSTKPAALATALSSVASLLLTAYSSESFSTPHFESSLSYQSGETSTSNASTNADQNATEQDHRITMILAIVIPLVVIFGAVAVTLGVLARRSRIHFTAVSDCLRRRKGTFTFTSEPPLTPRSTEPDQESNYASLHELGVKRDDHIYADFVQRSFSTNSATGEAVYENGPAHLSS